MGEEQAPLYLPLRGMSFSLYDSSAVPLSKEYPHPEVLEPTSSERVAAGQLAGPSFTGMGTIPSLPS